MSCQWVELCSVRVDGIPKGKQQKRSFTIKICPLKHQFQPQKALCPKCGKPGTAVSRQHMSGTAEAWKASVAAAMLPHRPMAPLDEPVRADVDIYFQRPQSFNKRTRTAYGGSSRDVPSGPVWFTSKPDRDNSDGAVLDALSQMGFWRDDALACDGRIRKFYHGLGGRPGAKIRIMVWRKV